MILTIQFEDVMICYYVMLVQFQRVVIVYGRVFALRDIQMW